MISPETLRFYPLFSHQDSEMLARIGMLAEENEYETNQPLFFEGEIANTLYLIREGSVVLTMNMPGDEGIQKERELEPLGKGEVIGWSSIVPPHIYKLNAYTSKKSILIKFDGKALRQLFDESPSFGYYFIDKIAEVIGNRLISKCVQIASLSS